jgi:hypothetical protein
MSPAMKGRTGRRALSQDYRRAIKEANVTGLATGEHYETVFAALADEQRRALCGCVPFAVAVRDVGVDVGGVAFVGVRPPGTALPAEVVEALVEINEVWRPLGRRYLRCERLVETGLSASKSPVAATAASSWWLWVTSGVHGCATSHGHKIKLASGRVLIRDGTGTASWVAAQCLRVRSGGQCCPRVGVLREGANPDAAAGGGGSGGSG